MEHKGTRRIESSELSDILRSLEATGVEIPTLYHCKSIPTYVRTENDVEIYDLEGRRIEVHPGEQIDSYGNVVNLRLLEAQVGMFHHVEEEHSEKMDRVYGRIFHPESDELFEKPPKKDYIK